MPDIGIVELESEILENQSKFCKNPAFSDVTFLIGDEKLPAYRLPLATQSHAFEVLLFGTNYLESGQRMIRIEVPLNAMKMLLTYVYSGRIDLRNYVLPDVADLLELAHRYEFQSLEAHVVQYLCIAVNAVDVRGVLDVALLVSYRDLIERCWIIVEMIAEGIYDVELDFTYNLLIDLLDRSPRKVSEVKLFQFAAKLMKSFSTASQKRTILSKIDLSKMSVDKLFDTVKPTGLVDAEDLCRIVATFSLHKVVPLHKELTPQIATVPIAQNGEFLFENDDEYTFTDGPENCILVDLNALYLINWIKFEITADGIDQYFIEISTSEETWTKIIEYSNALHGQELFFQDSIARFIKIVPASGYLGCCSLQIGHVEHPEKSLGGFVCPENNVAIQGKATVIIEGSLEVDNIADYLLAGDHDDQITIPPYTAHRLPVGGFEIEFHQPYILSSCRFLLWTNDGTKYSYIVKVAPDHNLEYETISDKNNELLDGWQRIDFAPRPVLRFFVQGTRATKHNEFRLTYFESPAQNQIVINNGQKKMKL